MKPTPPQRINGAENSCYDISAQVRATAQADLTGAGPPTGPAGLAQAVVSAAERKAAAIRAEHAARAAAVDRARRRR